MKRNKSFLNYKLGSLDSRAESTRTLPWKYFYTAISRPFFCLNSEGHHSHLKKFNLWKLLTPFQFLIQSYFGAQIPSQGYSIIFKDPLCCTRRILDHCLHFLFLSHLLFPPSSFLLFLQLFFPPLSSSLLQWIYCYQSLVPKTLKRKSIFLENSSKALVPGLAWVTSPCVWSGLKDVAVMGQGLAVKSRNGELQGLNNRKQWLLKASEALSYWKNGGNGVDAGKKKQ